MAVIEALAVVIIVLLAIVTVLIFAAVIGASVLVTVAVRREERLRSLTSKAPGWTARLARMLLAVPAPRIADEIFPRPRPAEKPAWYERSTGSTMDGPSSDT
jgi:hypothetical protein